MLGTTLLGLFRYRATTPCGTAVLVLLGNTRLELTVLRCRERLCATWASEVVLYMGTTLAVGVLVRVNGSRRQAWELLIPIIQARLEKLRLLVLSNKVVSWVSVELVRLRGSIKLE